MKESIKASQDLDRIRAGETNGGPLIQERQRHGRGNTTDSCCIFLKKVSYHINSYILKCMNTLNLQYRTVCYRDAEV